MDTDIPEPTIALFNRSEDGIITIEHSNGEEPNHYLITAEQLEYILNERNGIMGRLNSIQRKTTTFERVLEFHHTFRHPINLPHAMDDEDLMRLRFRLIEEELKELRDAYEARDIVEMADALADLDYVITGFAIVLGIDHDAVGAEVHRSNMSKLGADGQPIYRTDGKVQKGPSYELPDVATVLANGFHHR